MRIFIISCLFAAIWLVNAPAVFGKDAGGPVLGSKGSGPVIDKSGDKTLQAMLAEVVPQFKELEFKDPKTNKTLRYALFTPAKTAAEARYPLVMFMADASLAGRDVKESLQQGYGALVWATKANQAKNPCYVLVPQFAGVAVNDAYALTDEVDLAMRLLEDMLAKENVDSKRVYATGQSMGGMISMYFNVAYPDIFAASLFVDCHWNPADFIKLAKSDFIFVVAGDKGKAFANIAPLEEACEKLGRAYTFASWSARLPQETQDDLASVMLDKGAPINIFEFEPGTVLPENGQGSEHMYSFDYAYKLAPVRSWLFAHAKK